MATLRPVFFSWLNTLEASSLFKNLTSQPGSALISEAGCTAPCHPMAIIRTSGLESTSHRSRSIVKSCVFDTVRRDPSGLTWMSETGRGRQLNVVKPKQHHPNFPGGLHTPQVIAAMTAAAAMTFFCLGFMPEGGDWSQLTGSQSGLQTGKFVRLKRLPKGFPSIDLAPCLFQKLRC